MEELTVNLHLHTIYSDGSGTHAELAKAALATGVDVLMVTDHNTWVEGVDAYFREGRKRVLLFTGEEVHDQGRDPQKNHLLLFGTGREMAALADSPQALIDAVRAAGGICFIAHPIDPPLAIFGEDDISWVDWQAGGFTGIELWNGFSELKSIIRNKLQGIFYAYFPEAIARGPLPETLRLWDRLLAGERRVVAVGGADAHARHMSLGPLHRVIFPYEYHFSAVNTHVLVPNPLLGEVNTDKRMVLEALSEGHCFIGYDLPARTNGFRFSAHGHGNSVIMGDEIKSEGGVTIQVNFPAPPGEAHLLRNGQVIQKIHSQALTYTTSDPGVYRVEAYRHYLGRKRGWIFSNPIYVR